MGEWLQLAYVHLQIILCLRNANTNHKKPIIKYEGLGNQLMHAASKY
jgi:hypothetical protein